MEAYSSKLLSPVTIHERYLVLLEHQIWSRMLDDAVLYEIGRFALRNGHRRLKDHKYLRYRFASFCQQ